ncbi:MAG: DoxX family protein [Myxococcales bacterium]|nr:DoxX family protein [Myxococcales bacterium]
MNLLRRLPSADAPAATVLIRLDPLTRSAGRFARIGIPAADVMGPLVGATEVVCGLLVLVGLATRLAAAPLVATMSVAVVSTKIPILLGHGFWGFQIRTLPSYGFWSMAHEARCDVSMLLGALFLVFVGTGPWSLDRRLARRMGL